MDKQRLKVLTESKIIEAKGKVKLLGLDFDGTVSNGNDFKDQQVFELVEKVLAKGISVAFITARASTAIKKLFPPLKEILLANNYDMPNFIAGANGTTLYEVKKDQLIPIYNHGFNLEEVKKAVEGGLKVYKELGINREDLAEKGIETFKKFLADEWEGYIPSEILEVCKAYDGNLFTEEAKVTFVLPRDKEIHKKIALMINEELGNGYNAVAGDETYIHITKKLQEDSKKVAIKSILKVMGLNEDQVITFGDMPLDNDAGLLDFPFGFTNSDEYADQKTDEAQPFVLLDDSLSPVARVYKTIEYLIS